MGLDRRLLSHFDWVFFSLTLALSGMGLLTLYSAAQTTGGGVSPIFWKQLAWIGLGIVALLVVVSVDYLTLCRLAYPLFATSVLFLLLVLVLGKRGMGAQRWFALGPLAFQPSEFAKLALLLALARYFAADERQGSLSLKGILLPACLVGIPVVLVLMQPDMGTAVLMLALFGAVVLVAGVRMRPLLVLGGVALVSLPVMGPWLWGMLKPYQQDRIRVFLNPDLDPLGLGYHITQSKIAIGSGQFLGKGYLAGTQGQLRFLPERHTDFIFSLFAEEWGFLGALVLLLLYGLLLLWGLETAHLARDRLGSLLAAGVVGMLFCYLFVNVGMALGIMPVVGVPLPLVSYGGSSILATYAAVGLLLNIRMRRFKMF